MMMHLHRLHLHHCLLIHHSWLVSSRKWVCRRCASPLLSRTHRVAGYSCCRPNAHTGSTT